MLSIKCICKANHTSQSKNEGPVQCLCFLSSNSLGIGLVFCIKDIWMTSLQLSEPLDLSGSEIQAVVLPTQGQDTPAGTPGIVTGWGATSVSNPKL